MTVREITELDQLMLRAGRGDRGAFKQFYDEAAPSVLAIVLKMLKDRFVAEDVLQEAMVTAWHKAAQFDPERAAATTWITTIARRRALDVLRSGKRYSDLLHDKAPDIRETYDTAPEEVRTDAESRATAVRLEQCFAQLQSGAAQCIQLAYLEGLTFSEIAARTTHSINTVKSWIRRGMARLQGCMRR